MHFNYLTILSQVTFDVHLPPPWHECERHSVKKLGDSGDQPYHIPHPSKKAYGWIQETKYLRDVLVRAAIPPLAGDEKSNPNHKTPTMTETVDNTPEPITQVNKQLKMDQFLTKNEKLTNGSTEKICQPTISKTQPQGTSMKEPWFNFCNKSTCKYCKILGVIVVLHVCDLDATLYLMLKQM